MPVTSCSSTEEVAQVSLQLGNSQIWESLQAKKIHEYTNLKLKKYINTQTYKYKQARPKEVAFVSQHFKSYHQLIWLNNILECKKHSNVSLLELAYIWTLNQHRREKWKDIACCKFNYYCQKLQYWNWGRGEMGSGIINNVYKYADYPPLP